MDCLFEDSVQECDVNVHLVDLKVHECSHCQKDSNGPVVGDWRAGLEEIDAMALAETLTDQARFELGDMSILVLFDFEDPFHANGLLLCPFNDFPHSFLPQTSQLSFDCFRPLVRLWAIHGLLEGARCLEICSFGSCESMLDHGGHVGLADDVKRLVSLPIVGWRDEIQVVSDDCVSRVAF